MLCPQWGDGRRRGGAGLRWRHTCGLSPGDALAGTHGALNPSLYCLGGDRHFKPFSIYLRLPVKLVKKQLWLARSLGCGESAWCGATVWLWLVMCRTFRGRPARAGWICDSGWVASGRGRDVGPQLSYLVSMKARFGKPEIKLQAFRSWRSGVP